MARILICEDDASVRTFVSRVLQMDGHEVHAADDGFEGLERINEENGNFDLLLSDIKMPGMDGIELATNTARDWPDLTILLMTGYADQRERAGHLQEIVHDVVLKPFSLTDLRRAVDEALDLHPTTH